MMKHEINLSHKNIIRSQNKQITKTMVRLRSTLGILCPRLVEF